MDKRILLPELAELGLISTYHQVTAKQIWWLCCCCRWKATQAWFSVNSQRIW